jgi:hypothetical protein
MTLSKVQAEALGLAREVQRLASACAGLNAALDKGWPAVGDEQTLSALRVEWGAASRHFDALVASVSVAHRAEWAPYVQAIAQALTGLSGQQERAARYLVPAWQLAAAGRAPADFAGDYLEGVLLVEQNYRLLLKSGALPRGFPRVPRVG